MDVVIHEDRHERRRSRSTQSCEVQVLARGHCCDVISCHVFVLVDVYFIAILYLRHLCSFALLITKIRLFEEWTGVIDC